MASIRYFATVDGETVQFPRVDYRPIDSRRPFGPVAAYGWHAATRSWVKIERTIEYKAFGSKHECDDRCINATGKTMQCECSCGGKNHGKGAFNCTSEAA